MSQLCMHYLVTGKVQGVWYRAYTQKQAKHLGLTGWVKNLRNGGVEVVACGNEEQLDALHQWLQHGPPLARVTQVLCTHQPWQEFSDFSIHTSS